MKRKIINISLAAALGLATMSCVARKNYERPADVVNENLYRTDKIAVDDKSIASVSW